MKEKRKRILFLILLCISLCACEKKTQIEIEEPKSMDRIETKPEIKEVDSKVYVYVCGSVKNPGVYKLKTKARLYEAIEAAGGLCDDAEEQTLNQAREIVDGERIYVPSSQDLEKGLFDTETIVHDENSTGGKVNINTAGKEELMTLPGIGESKAECILSYRKSKGQFDSVEELMEIEGIKEGVFNKIKDKIVVAR